MSDAITPTETATPPVVPVAPVAPVEAPAPNPWDSPEAARAEIEKLRRENGAERVNAKATAAAEAKAAYAQEIGKLLGLVKGDEPADPTILTEQLTSSQAAAKASALELAVYKAAGTAKADPSALLDSRDFLTKIAGIDPTDSAALAAAISEATTSNPRFKVAQAATVGGADFSGGAAVARSYTRGQLADQAFYSANRTDILAALKTGRITE